jgi:hypothetical protein
MELGAAAAALIGGGPGGTGTGVYPASRACNASFGRTVVKPRGVGTPSSFPFLSMTESSFPVTDPVTRSFMSPSSDDIIDVKEVGQGRGDGVKTRF